MLRLTGTRFGKLIVIQKMNTNKWGSYLWLCLCDCGKEIIVIGGDLKSGHSKSCGCTKIKHGQKKNGKTSKIYLSWYHMVDRCTNHKSKYYSHYGGRGITICQQWKKFENFLEDMEEPPTSKHQIDRIDNNKGYYKKNCHWVTPKQQQRNKRNNHLETFNGKTQCIAAWAEEVGINKDTLYCRINRGGWSIERTLTTPVKTNV